MDENVFEVRDLVKVYPGQTEPANKGISLDIHRGEIFGMLGDNGAGKTTLVRQMVNLLRSTSGSISLFGQPISRDPAHVALNVGYMPQDGHGLDNLSVGEAIYFTAHLRGLTRAEARAERESLLDLWGIAGLAGKPCSQLSGGQRRLLRLAIAMAGSPPVLILDEPTNDLDPLRRKLTWDVLRQVNLERGTTIIFITHDAIEAEKVIQRVAIMRDGEMAAIGRPSDLKRLVDRQLRLELIFSPGTPPLLPAGMEHHELQPGRWLVYLERNEAMAALDRIDLTRVDDFRLYSATLEDLYIHYATR